MIKSKYFIMNICYLKKEFNIEFNPSLIIIFKIAKPFMNKYFL